MIEKSKIRILQHNVAKSTNTMISCLKYAFDQKTDIILMQKSWIENNEIIIFHFAYDQIMPSISAEMIDQNKKFRIMIFVSKKSILKITFKFDILNDSDFQILHITNIDIDNCMIINIYNEKNQFSTSNEYTIERILTKLNYQQFQLFVIILTHIMYDEISAFSFQFEQIHWLIDWLKINVNW